MMSRVGNNAAAAVATIVCIALALSIVLPFSGAESMDTTSPVTNASVTGTPGNNGWYTSNATVTLTAVDNGSGVAHTYYRLDGGALVTYTSSFTVYDGNHTLIFYSVDYAGNTEPISYSHNYLNIKVDTMPPAMNMTINGSLNATTKNYNGTATVNLTASDNCSGTSSISYSLNKNTSPDLYNWMPYTGNITIPDGQYTLYYGSVDTAGNTYNNSTGISVFNPMILTSPECNKWYSDDITVSYILPDDVDHVEYTYDRKTWHRNASFDLFVEGNISIFYKAIGKSGDVSDTRLMWFGIDKTGPTIGIGIDGDKSSSGWYNGDITVHINAKDNGSISHTEYSWDDKNWINYSGPFKVSWGSSRTIWYRTADMMDRRASGSAFIYFRPASFDQGPMSDSIWINGVTYGPSSGTSSSVTPTPRPTATPVPLPTPTLVPSPPPETPGSNSPLAIGILVAVLALIVVAGAAVYFFMLKPK